MKLTEKKKNDLDKRFQRILQSPEGFDFFEAIHDFIEYIELDPAMAGSLLRSTKFNKGLNIGVKYGYLLQIYKGIEDADAKDTEDLGHERQVNIRDLNRIRNQELSESNYFWKKRQLFRKLAGEIYERLKMDYAPATL